MIKLDHIRHALGLNNAKVSYRNYFTTAPGMSTWGDIQELVADGLMIRLGRLDGGTIIFSVTEKGKEAVSQ